jgi:predicted hotdog family 3-hydroxylacyl-ACP dehydratase
MQLNRAWIEAHIPHQGRMCLLDEVLRWGPDRISCLSCGHRAADHPLRAHDRLGAACGIELAAQAMAVHGALGAAALGLGKLTADARSGGTRSAPSRAAALADTSVNRPVGGFIASVRGVRLHVPRLDDVEADLICDAVRMAGDQRTALYEFELRSVAGRLLSGRATVVLDGDYRLAL